MNIFLHSLRPRRALWWGTASLLLAGAVPAATLTWDPNGATPPNPSEGSGIWTAANNWWDGSANVTWTANNTAVFGTGTDGAYGLNVGGLPYPAVSNIWFKSSGFTLTNDLPQLLAVSSTAGATTPQVRIDPGKTVTVGANVTLEYNQSAGNGLYIGATATATAPLNQGGTLVIENGGLVRNTNSAGSLYVDGVGTVVNVNPGGTLAQAGTGNGAITLGQQTGANCILNVQGGTVSSAGSGTIAGMLVGNLGTATVNLTSGTLLMGTGANGLALAYGTTGNGTFNLDGGTLSATAVKTKSGPSSVFNFNGGTLKAVIASTAFMTNLTRANVRDGGAIIDDNGLAITIGQTLAHSSISGDAATDGGLTKLGAGTLTLFKAISYNGGTTINEGTLKQGVANTFGADPGTKVVINSPGILDLNGKGCYLNTFSGSGTVDNTSATACTLQIGRYNLGGTFSGVIQNTGGGALAFWKWGTGTTVLSGLSTYSGLTWCIAGTLSVNSISSVASPAPSALGSPATVANATIKMVNNGGNGTATLKYTGPTVSTDRVIDLTAGAGGSGILDASGTGPITFTSDFTASQAGSKSLVLSGTNTDANTIAGAIVDNSPGTYTTSLAKSGAGTWVLNAANPYSGNTTINAGTLALGLSGSIANSPLITVATNGTFDVTAAGFVLGGSQTLSGYGTINGNLSDSYGSQILPGGSGTVGTLTFNNDLTLAGGDTVKFDFDGTTNDVLVVGGNLNPSGVTTIQLATAPPGGYPSGTYALMFVTGTLGGDTNNFALLGVPSPSRQTFALVYDNVSTPRRLLLQVGGSNASLVWQGGLGANAWDITTTANWLNGAGSDVYFDGDAVRFTDLGAANPPALDTVVTPLSVTFDAANAYTLSGSGAISGGTGLIKTNSGLLTLATANTYSGVTYLGGGTVSINSLANGGVASPIGAASSAAANLVFDGGALKYTGPATASDRAATLQAGGGALEVEDATSSVTLNGPIVGTAGGAFTKSGPGTLVLSGTNTFNGGLTVAAGTLKLGGAVTPLGSTNAAAVISNGATLDLAGFASATSKPVIVSGSGTDGTNAITSSAPIASPFIGLRFVTLAGDTVLTAPTRWDIGHNTTGGTLAGNGFKLTLTGTNDMSLNLLGETDLGDVVVSNRTLFIQGNTTLGRLTNAVFVSPGSALNLYGTGVTIDKPVSLAGGTLANGFGIVTNQGGITLTANSSLSVASNLTVSGAISGPYSLTSSGAGTTVLAAANTFSGGITNSGGVLQANHDAALGTGALTISPGALRLAVNDGITITNDLFITGGTGATGRGLIENSGTGNATLANGTITITGLPSAGGHFVGAGGGTLTLAGPIVSSVPIYHRNGTVVYKGGGDYTNFIVYQGTAKLGANNGLCTTSRTDIGQAAAATLDLAGFSQTLNGITRPNANAATITNSATSSDSTLTLTGTSLYGGLIQDAGVDGSRIALVINGGNFTLTNANSYSGSTTISGGTLTIGAGSTSGSLSNSSAILNNGTLVFNRSDSLTYANGISGTGTLTKQGAGTLNLGGTNSYSGGTTINAGTVLATSLGSGNVDVQSGAKLGAGLGNTVATLTLSANLTLNSSELLFDIASYASADKIVVGGDLTPSGTTTITLSSATAPPNGDYTLLEVSGTLGGSAANFSVTGPVAKSYAIVYQYGTPNRVVLQVTGSFVNKTWMGDGLANQWDINLSPNWVETGGLTPAVYLDSDAITFGNTSTNLNVDLSTMVTPASLTIVSTNSYTFRGVGAIAGATSLVKGGGTAGTGALRLCTANTFTGPVTVTAGSLIITNASALGTGPKTLVVKSTAGNFAELHLDGSSGPVILPPEFFFDTYGDASFQGNIVNDAGDNVVNGSLNMNSGGSNPKLAVLGGSLTFNGDIGCTNNTSSKIMQLAGLGTNRINGVIRNGTKTASLSVLGGTWILNNTNTYTGATLVATNGQLVVNGTSGSGAIIVQDGGRLSGTGMLSGATTVQSGGTLAPGALLGTLTFNNNLTLQGTALMEIARNGTTLTNDLATGVNTLTYGGTLLLTNIGASPLQVGDSFQLFAATNCAGTFANIVYPDGYTFTNSLYVDGRVWVASLASTTPPNFPPGGISRLPDRSISLTATGAMGATFKLWASTNVALTPITNTWTLLSNGTVTVSPFTIIDTEATNSPRRFYLFSTP